MLRFAKRSVILLIGTLLIFISCEKADRMMGRVPVTPSMDETVSNTPGTPVKLVYLIDFPEGGKDAYLQQVAVNAPTLQAPKEVLRIRAYENVQADMSPHRMVEFDFGSFLDAATYMNYPEIAAIFEDLPNYSTEVTLHTFIQRSSYNANEETDNSPVKGILLINYHLGGRDAYLQWAASVAETISTPPQLQALAVYENYYGHPPHRLVTGEFASQEEADAYDALEEIQMIKTELDNRASSWVEYEFQLRSDYINTPDEDH